MKTKFLGLTLSVLALALLAVPANAQFFTLQFDEHGNGLLNGAPDPGYLAIDPLSGLLALTYNLPNPVGTGDVGVLDPNGSIGDGIRFENVANLNGGVTVMFYFSDNADGVDALADSGIPQGNFANFNVPELADGSFVFLANGGGNNSYFGLSDTDTPEPGSLLLLGSGLLSVIGIARRRFLS